jgi:ribonuclease HI
MIVIYTDGGCDNRVGFKRGGWGALLSFEGKEKRICGGVPDTTSNRMELTAPLMALKALKRHDLEVHIHSDSQYLINGMNDWHYGWLKNKWRGSAGKPVINQDLWLQLLEWNKRLKITWTWVKGHSGHPEQEVAHHLASEGIASITPVLPDSVAPAALSKRKKK